MSESLFDPPAIHQRGERPIGELLEELKSLHEQGERQGREYIATRHKEGEVLIRLKQRVGHTNWQRWCEEHLPYDIRTARRRMREAEKRRQTKTDTVSVLDDDMKAQLQDDEAVAETESSDASIPSSVANVPSSPAPWPENNRCRDCRVNSRNDPKCKACAALNPPSESPPGAAEDAPDPPPAEEPAADAEPGEWQFCKTCDEKGYAKGCKLCRLLNGRDMTPDEVAEHDPDVPKPPPSLIKKLEKAYDSLWGVYRAIGKQFDLPVGKSVIDPETHPSMRAMIEMHAELKQRTKRFIWQHQAKKQHK